MLRRTYECFSAIGWCLTSFCLAHSPNLPATQGVTRAPAGSNSPAWTHPPNCTGKFWWSRMLTFTANYHFFVEGILPSKRPNNSWLGLYPPEMLSQNARLCHQDRTNLANLHRRLGVRVWMLRGRHVIDLARLHRMYLSISVESVTHCL